MAADKKKSSSQESAASAQKLLTDFEKFVLDHKGTERPFTGLYTEFDAPGVYVCKKCTHPLYKSEHKFPSHCGWPSFDDEIPGTVARQPDKDGKRTEILCGSCGAHLGHIFQGEFLTPKNIRHCVNSVSLKFIPRLDQAQKTILLASGCFWGTQHYLARVIGVVKTEVGYTGGHKEHPTYKEVCTGKTGHVEACLVTYDPARVDLEEILQIYFETHDFTQLDGQGPDIGPQYLSVMFYDDDQEQRLMEKMLAELSKMGFKPATKIAKRGAFWPAEDYHQNYYENKGDTPYCHIYRKIFPRAKIALSGQDHL